MRRPNVINSGFTALVAIAALAVSAGSASAAVDRTPPSAPGKIAASKLSTNSVVLSFAAARDTGGIRGYQFALSNKRKLFFVNASRTKRYKIQLVGLKELTRYTFTITAVNAAGLPGKPAKISVRTLSSVVDPNLTAVPTPPVGAPVVGGGATPVATPTSGTTTPATTTPTTTTPASTTPATTTPTTTTPTTSTPSTPAPTKPAPTTTTPAPTTTPATTTPPASGTSSGCGGLVSVINPFCWFK